MKMEKARRKRKMNKKKILFICKHNVFRSRTAEVLFNKYNKNKKYSANSAGLIKYEKKDLIGDKGYHAEKDAWKELGLKVNLNSKALDSSVLKNIDIVVIVADDVPKEIFNDKITKAKVILWKIKDVKSDYKNKHAVAMNSIKQIDKKVLGFVRSLR